jgi:hypothetical protein
MQNPNIGLSFVTATLLTAILMSAANARDVVSARFQSGVDGYAGTVDRFISTDPEDEANGIEFASYFFDGINDSGSSPDTQGLFRFENVVGSEDGQVPPGATILGARITVTTSVRGNAQTSGPYGISGLLQKENWLPFDEFTTYDEFEAVLESEAPSRGAWWQDGYATRPVGGFGFQLPGQPDTANVTPVVQAWADGTYDNHGFVIQAGRSDFEGSTANTSDGWAIRTTGFPIPDTRPVLEVEYTTEPVEINTFQQGVADYSGTTMAVVRSGNNALEPDPDDPLLPEITEDGLDLDQTFLDGLQFADIDGNTNSPDDFALLKFDGVFGGDPGQAPGEVPVARAWAVMTTGDTSGSAPSSGPWSAHSMLRPWDTTSLHSSFGDINGLQVDDGDISPTLDTLDGFIRGAEVWFDVTDYLEGVRNGAEDHGLAVLTKGTADGWQIHATGSFEETARPRLVVYSADLSGGTTNPTDCNGDGLVDSADADCWAQLGEQDLLDQTLAEIGSLRADANFDGTVNFPDFVVLSNNWENEPALYSDGDFAADDGAVGFSDFVLLSNNWEQAAGGAAAAAVPEPAGLSLIILAAGFLLRGSRRHKP